MANKHNEAKQFLHKKPVESGPSLYEHLSEVLLKFLVEKPANAVELFEHISCEVKSISIAPKAISKGDEDEQSLEAAKQSQKVRTLQLDWASKTLKLFKVLDDPPAKFPSFPDLMNESNMWEWAGISLGQEHTYRLFLSIKTLAMSLPTGHDSLRFWGKITTRSGDYFLVQGKAFEEIAGMDPNTMEGLNGANKYVYWVSKSYISKWEQLPPVTMEQIVVARQIKRLLTGNLDSEVTSYPPFPGKERELLRAQIARITHGTSVSPEGFYKEEEDEERPERERAQLVFNSAEELNENFSSPKPLEDMKVASSWVHHELEINVRGRVQKMPEQKDEEGEVIDDENEPDQIDALRPLDADEDGNAWIFRTGPCGTGESPKSHVIAQSLIWPGAYSIFFGKRFVNIYIGDAVKFSPVSFTPMAPPALQKEWAPNEDEGEEPLLEMPDVLLDPNPPEEEEEDDS